MEIQLEFWVFIQGWYKFPTTDDSYFPFLESLPFIFMFY